MLNHDERRRLSEIEHHLAAQDPAFAARMRMPTTDRPFPTLAVLCASFYILTPIAMVLGGSRAGLVTTIAFVASIAIILLRRRSRQSTRRPPLPGPTTR